MAQQQKTTCKLTPDVIAKIAEAISKGAFRSVAAKACGISTRTYYHWMRRARLEAGTGSIYDLLQQAIRSAETRAEINAVERIIAAGAEDPKHLQWWLERKYPERWGRDRLAVQDLRKRIQQLEEQLDVPDAAAVGGEGGESGEADCEEGPSTQPQPLSVRPGRVLPGGASMRTDS